MPLVNLFKSGIEDISKERPTALSLMQTEMDIFMLQLDIDVRQVNGPYVSYIPPESENSQERVVYTANIVYNNKSKSD